MKRLFCSFLLFLSLFCIFPACGLSAVVKEVYRFSIGRYEVGADIAPGTYTVTPYEKNRFAAVVTIGDSLNVYGDPIGNNADYLRLSLSTPSLEDGTIKDPLPSFMVTLRSSQQIHVHTDDVIFRLVDSASEPDLPVGDSDFNESAPYDPDVIFPRFDYDSVVSSPSQYAREMFNVYGTVLSVIGSAQEGYNLVVAVDGSLSKMVFMRVEPDFAPSFTIQELDSIHSLAEFVKMYDFDLSGEPSSAPLLLSAYVSLE